MRSVLLACLLWLATSALAVTDCSRAHSAVEKMLCTSARAAQADQRLALAFRAAFGRAADRDVLLADQRRWQAQVRDACADVDCLLRVFDGRIADLEDWR